MNLYNIKLKDLEYHQRTEEEIAEEEKLGLENRFNDDDEIAELAEEEFETIKDETVSSLYNSIQSSEYLTKKDKIVLIHSLIRNLIEMRDSIIEEK